jgi:hypothetical protein
VRGDTEQGRGHAIAKAEKRGLAIAAGFVQPGLNDGSRWERET